MPASLISALRSARHVVVFTGAGVSAESGIPTFRDALTGLWERFDPGELATPEAFRRDPALVWGWYEWRRMRVLQSQPNPAHLAIADLARHVPQLTLITQNVDDLHERAGSEDVIHLHGSLHRPRCFACAREPAEATAGRRRARRRSSPRTAPLPPLRRTAAPWRRLVRRESARRCTQCRVPGGWRMRPAAVGRHLRRGLPRRGGAASGA